MGTSFQEAQVTPVDRTSLSVKQASQKQASKVVEVWVPEYYFKAAAPQRQCQSSKQLSSDILKAAKIPK